MSMVVLSRVGGNQQSVLSRGPLPSHFSPHGGVGGLQLDIGSQPASYMGKEGRAVWSCGGHGWSQVVTELVFVAAGSWWRGCSGPCRVWLSLALSRFRDNGTHTCPAYLPFCPVPVTVPAACGKGLVKTQTHAKCPAPHVPTSRGQVGRGPLRSRVLCDSPHKCTRRSQETQALTAILSKTHWMGRPAPLLPWAPRVPQRCPRPPPRPSTPSGLRQRAFP